MALSKPGKMHTTEVLIADVLVLAPAAKHFEAGLAGVPGKNVS